MTIKTNEKNENIFLKEKIKKQRFVALIRFGEDTRDKLTQRR